MAAGCRECALNIGARQELHTRLSTRGYTETEIFDVIGLGTGRYKCCRCQITTALPIQDVPLGYSTAVKQDAYALATSEPQTHCLTCREPLNGCKCVPT